MLFIIVKKIHVNLKPIAVSLFVEFTTYMSQPSDININFSYEKDPTRSFNLLVLAFWPLGFTISGGSY
jgi:hypothetical protein